MSREPPHTTATATAAVSTVATVCTNCCFDDRWILHSVRLRGVYRKLCTSCVLKLHPTSFCPTCFSLHDPPSSTAIVNSGKTLTCFKCSSISHSSCVPPNAPRSPYLCFICSNSSFKFFDFRKSSANLSTNLSQGDQKVVEGERKSSQVLDERAARILVAAAKIASNSMNRAATTARAEAEKKVKEAALARKRAKEAIDYVTVLSARVVAVGGVKRREVEVPCLVGLKPANVVPVRLEKNGGIGRVNNGGGSEMNGNSSNPSNGPVVGSSINNHVVGGVKDGALPQAK